MRPRKNSEERRGLPILSDEGFELRSTLYSENLIKVDPGGIEVSARKLLLWASNLLFNAGSRQDEFLREIFSNHNWFRCHERVGVIYSSVTAFSIAFCLDMKKRGGWWREATLYYIITLLVHGPGWPPCIFDEGENMVCERRTDYKMYDIDRRYHGLALGWGQI